MWTLRSTEPELSYRLLAGEVRTIGRAAGAQFVVDAPLVSRIHCRLTVAPDETLIIEDLDSTNGTFVNGQRTVGATPVSESATLRVGRVEFDVARS